MSHIITNDKMVRDVSVSRQAVSLSVRRRRRRSLKTGQGVAWESTRLTAKQEMLHDAVSGGKMPLTSVDAVDQALRTVDLLSQYAKDQSCTPDHRRQIFALKNMVILLLWKQKREMYVGIWKHTSRSTEMTCWACNGSGDAPNTIERCPRCQGTCVWTRSENNNVFCVFAVQGGTYATTWHLPASVVDRLLGHITQSTDLVATYQWPAYDLRKIPISLTLLDYEHNRSYLAWFVTRSSGE